MFEKNENTEKMPLLFVGHGNPMNAIEENEFVETWRELGKSLPKPKSILCISAHWETRGTFVTAMKHPKTIHDFRGFPRELFDVQYPAQGNPQLAEETQNLSKNNIIGLDKEWGLDHGCWSVLGRMYPNANIPIVQLSLDYGQTPLYHYNLAKELHPLREKGILIIGSGNLVHNLKMIAWEHWNDIDYSYDWAQEANEIIKSLIMANDYSSLINYKSLGQSIHLAIPSPEHFLPLLYIMALKRENEKISFFNDKSVAGSLTMTSVKIDS